ncbi:ISKra4 family transposase [Dactylosporangium sp. CA-152071]|uniref:ISKra4 family transposase n=1 Tax=Dactylosporangium sp. CA-152071 TaxID=3239933 RepID=UPI003D936505
MAVYAGPGGGVGFERSRQRFEAVVGWLAGGNAGELSHAELEERLTVEAREVTRVLLQDHLDLRAVREERLPEVVGVDTVTRRYAERGHTRGLVTVFGQVSVERIAYRAKGAGNLAPADGVLNLPDGLHSHGLRRLAAIEAATGSFESATAAIERATGVGVGKRQVEALAAAAAVDVDAFYASRQHPAVPVGDVVVLTADAKGIVMRHDALREPTARKAAAGGHKLATRLSRGEKSGRKRMAEVVAVYHCTPAPRTPDDVIAPPAAHTGGERRERRAGPKAAGKWLHASVTDDAATVIAAMFDQAERADPDVARPWIVLVDGNTHQIDLITAQARARHHPVTIIVDFVHVLEYVWKAAWSLHAEGDPAAETWVAAQARDVLAGRAHRVAGRIQRTIAQRGLTTERRKGADACVTYLLNKARYLRYHQALTNGWPIATGVIEGACRHLLKDRMDITGARWGLPGAEAILKLRALISNGDFDTYWAYHLEQEHHRVHTSRYPDGIIPAPA